MIAVVAAEVVLVDSIARERAAIVIVVVVSLL